MAALIACVSVSPNIWASSFCKPARGGVWSRLAYSVPVVRLPQKTYLELAAPNRKYKLVVKGGVYPALTVFEEKRPLKIILPSWVKSPEDLSNPRFVQSTGAEFMWAPDSHIFSATENYDLASPEVAAGGWRVLVYLIHSPDVTPIFVDTHAAAAYKRTFNCEYPPGIGALKWVTENRLLLIAEGSSGELCKDRRWLHQSTRGYLVAIPSGRIVKTYSQKELARWRNIFGSSGVYGHPYQHQKDCSQGSHGDD